MKNNQNPENSEEQYNGILGDYQEKPKDPQLPVPETASVPKKTNPLKVAGIAVVSAAIIGCVGFFGIRPMLSSENNSDSTQLEETNPSGETSVPLPENTTAAVYSEHFEITPAVMSCLYHDYLNQYASALSYYGIDPATTSLKEEKLPEQAGEDMTWFDYIMSQVQNTASQLLIFQEAASADGYELTEEDKQRVEEQLATMDLSTYGENVTEDDARTMLELEILTSSYVEHLMNEMQFTDEELEEYYQENRKQFDTCSLMGFNVPYQTEEETSASDSESESSSETETEPETEAETQMPQEEAKAIADDLLSSSSPEEFESKISDFLKTHENYTDEDLEELSSSIRSDTFGYTEGFAAAEWAFGGTAKAGETHLIENDGYYSVYFLISEPARDDTETINVRHILFSTDNHMEDVQKDSNTTEEETSETEETSELSPEEQAAQEEAAMEICHTYAENALKEWESGDKTEDSFAELANQYSEDPGSNTTGGLYENVSPGDMVQAFNDWCFDSSRKTGDTGLVETEYGVHVMYFSGKGSPKWKITAESDLQSSKMDDWFAEQKTKFSTAANDDVINAIEE